MDEPVFIQSRYQSAYSLLGAMARELCEACVARGRDARLLDLATDPAPDEGVFVFFNAPVSLDAFPPAMWRAGSGLRAVQVFVDHPFALPDGMLDEWRRRTGLDNLRVCLPCADDVHLLRLRWAGLTHAFMPHGLSRGALCDAGGINRAGWDARDFDVVVTGSIAGEREIRAALARFNPSLAGMAREMASLMLDDAGIGYLQALDLVMGSRSVITGEWRAAQTFWRLCVAIVNRTRRVRAVEALAGLGVGVFGSEAWREVCRDDIVYAGEVGYGDIPAAFARGRVALAWGPTQFVHSYSERIMLAMGAGAAAVSDDRLLVRRDFPGVADLYDAARPASAREACDRLLADPDGALDMARRGRAWVEQRCLWEHRVDGLLELAGRRV